jgi:hypothetical protein
LGDSANIGVESARRLGGRSERASVTDFADSELSREATAVLLLPEGRPGVWLVLLAAVFSFVVVGAVGNVL